MKKALASIECQVFRDFELVVTDDGSTDGTDLFLEIYKPWFPVRVLRNEESMGASAARNRAIAHGEGGFITGIDDDDIWLPNRLSRFVECWSPGLALLGAQDYLVTRSRKIRWHKPAIIVHHALLYRNLIGNQVFTTRQNILDVGGYDERLSAAQDYDLWLRLIKKFGVGRILPEPLQEINMIPSPDRISSDISRVWGYYDCYLKHKSDMTRMHRKYHLFNIRNSMGKKLPLWKLPFYVPPQYLVKEIAKGLSGT